MRKRLDRDSPRSGSVERMTFASSNSSSSPELGAVHVAVAPDAESTTKRDQ